ncbi:MAG: DUF2330 domain-containing protein [Candidatus Eiseniibacteriota bacterium]
MLPCNRSMSAPVAKGGGSSRSGLSGAAASFAAVAVGLILTIAPGKAHAFCGFYVSQADAKLFNKASQVVLARDGDRTVLTMANDFKGDVKEFAIVVPVPTVLEKEQIHIGEKAWVDHLDKYSAPRLVEYHDPDPCAIVTAQEMLNVRGGRAGMAALKSFSAADAASGVVIEASYTIGEYDILILSARESSGLITWLKQNDYRVPEKGARVLNAYIKQGLKFFVAKVNLKEQAKLGFESLRPIQIAYESPRFMLPIRLGMTNADGAQELLLFTLTRKGRVEPVNYRLVKLPTDVEVPLFVREDFGPFYKALFDRQVAKEGMRTVFLEYAWNASWCDPCPTNPPTPDELANLGAAWIVDPSRGSGRGGPSDQVFVTRLHARYDAASFPEDLALQETANLETFQGRYILRNPFRGDCSCDEGQKYRTQLLERRAAQRKAVVELTGWSDANVRGRMAKGGDAYLPAVATGPQKWWNNLWKR